MIQTLIVFQGRPATKKNSLRVISGNGRTIVLPSKAYMNYERQILKDLRAYTGPKFKGPIQVRVLYWLPDRSHWPDLNGLMQATADILERAGIIENDRLIESWDGTRIAGITKDNSRAEIEIIGLDAP